MVKTYHICVFSLLFFISFTHTYAKKSTPPSPTLITRFWEHFIKNLTNNRFNKKTCPTLHKIDAFIAEPELILDIANFFATNSSNPRLIKIANNLTWLFKLADAPLSTMLPIEQLVSSNSNNNQALLTTMSATTIANQLHKTTTLQKLAENIKNAKQIAKRNKTLSPKEKKAYLHERNWQLGLTLLSYITGLFQRQNHNQHGWVVPYVIRNILQIWQQRRLSNYYERMTSLA